MVAIYLVYGLAFFCLGLAVLLEARRVSALPLGRQLPWLAAFGIVHSLVEWSDMLLLGETPEPQRTALLVARTILLPISALILIRFGVGLIGEAGPLPKWVLFAPVILVVPAAMLVAYALIITTADFYVATDVWSRYLLYFPGNLLSAFGFVRQGRGLGRVGLREARNLMYGATGAFLLNALVAGLIVPPAPYGLAPWVNYETIMDVTGLPVQLWRMTSAIAVTFFVIRALDVFEAERKQRLAKLSVERERALATLQESEERFRTIFELAPIGMDIVDSAGRPMQVNFALQEMLGYSANELRDMVFTDYTYPDDVDISRQLVSEVAEGKRDHFRLEKRYYRKDGQVMWGNVAVSAVRDADGELLYFIAMVEDMTERKLMEEALRLERERAQAVRLQTLTEARQTAESWVNSLVDITRRISEMENVDEVLLHIVQHTRCLLNADQACLGLLDETGSNLQLKCHALAEATCVPDSPTVIDNLLLMEMLRSGRPCFFPDAMDGVVGEWFSTTDSQAISSAVIAPLQFEGELVGGLWAGRYITDPFSQADLFGLESLADQSVIALQHASMAAQLQSVATLEERSRIAREMHDSLAQILGYVGVQMQTIEAYLDQGDGENARAEITQTRANIRAAQADVRENILSLRTTLAGDAGPVSALQAYLDEFGVQTGIETRLVSECGHAPALSPLAEVHLVRIVHEALANVRKHAQAQRVCVRLRQENNRLVVTVADDGVGFTTMNSDQHRFGLKTMQERARSIDGFLNIRSQPQQGTQIELILPLLTQ